MVRAQSVDVHAGDLHARDRLDRYLFPGVAEVLWKHPQGVSFGLCPRKIDRRLTQACGMTAAAWIGCIEPRCGACIFVSTWYDTELLFLCQHVGQLLV